MKKEILHLGVAPDRIDFIMNVVGAKFETTWKMHVEIRYGNARANWIDIDSLIRIKNRIDNSRHQEDARVLREVKKRLTKSSKAPNR